jgi:hypothetical protein
MMRMPVMGLPEWKEAVDCFAEDGCECRHPVDRRRVSVAEISGDAGSTTKSTRTCRADFVRELIDYAHTERAFACCSASRHLATMA